VLVGVLGDDTEYTDPILNSFTFHQVSQLDRDTSTALATIREWRNSFIPINRVPLDILSLIPTHLESHEDRFRASFVCRHWRSTFLQRAELWSQLFLSKGEDYVKTLLERAKGSVLDIIVDRRALVSTMALLSPHTEQIRDLGFLSNDWTNIRDFAEVNPRPALLRALSINIGTGFNVPDFPPLPLFTHLVNMKAFCYHSGSIHPPPFSHFVFPNLVLFEFTTTPVYDFLASQLLDFLEASPMLRTVDMKIRIADISLEGIPQGRVVVLPNVETFNLTVSDGEPGYKTAAHISCPSARYTSLTQEKGVQSAIPEEMFPCSSSWNAIICQYTRNPVEEVTLEVKTASTIICKLTFRSTCAAVVELCFKIATKDVDEDESENDLSEDIHSEAFTQATRVIRNHPQLANIKRLHICHSFCYIGSHSGPDTVDEVGRFFKSVGSLDSLTIYHCDLRPYLNSFLSPRECSLDRIGEPVFPPIRELIISCPIYPDERECTAIVELAKSHHALGTPFEHVVIRGGKVFEGAEERMRPWVSSVECYHDDDLCEMCSRTPMQRSMLYGKFNDSQINR
jgi:hypothetical protein